MSGRRRIRVARVYEDPGPDDGERVLVDRLWPRGFRKGDPRVGRWIPKVAPSTELRKWYSHEAERFDEFAARYAAELETEEGAAALAELQRRAARRPGHAGNRRARSGRQPRRGPRPTAVVGCWPCRQPRGRSRRGIRLAGHGARDLVHRDPAEVPCPRRDAADRSWHRPLGLSCAQRLRARAGRGGSRVLRHRGAGDVHRRRGQPSPSSPCLRRCWRCGRGSPAGPTPCSPVGRGHGHGRIGRTSALRSSK